MFKIIKNYLWQKCDSVLKYGRLSHYSSPESVLVITVRGMIYIQLSIWAFILLIALALGTTKTL